MKLCRRRDGGLRAASRRSSWYSGRSRSSGSPFSATCWSACLAPLEQLGRRATLGQVAQLLGQCVDELRPPVVGGGRVLEEDDVPLVTVLPRHERLMRVAVGLE